ncbi:cytidylate kinase [Clostridiales bacterium]|nr:cytidylate kinase [Clostridiales bacterium]
MEHYSIAIDGPAGSGKSTIAKLLSKRLGIVYVDTGAMYRGVAYYCMENGISTKDREAVEEAMDSIYMEIKMADGVQRIILNGKDISPFIRTADVGQGASDVGVFAYVRERLVKIQQEMAEKMSVIMDGRDIGTVVLPKAEVKIYLVARTEERARRRLKDYEAQGIKDSLSNVIEQIEKRDLNDMTRECNPLKKADDAIEIDSTNMTAEEVAETVINIVKEKVNTSE